LAYNGLDFGEHILARWKAHYLHPANFATDILRVHGEFKLADFGFAKFNPQGETVPRTYIEGGTETYGKMRVDMHSLTYKIWLTYQAAPEIDHMASKGTSVAVDQTIDTWSFGCVLSITATWIVLGFQGVLQYETVRKRAIQKLREQRAEDRAIIAPGADDAFHNGREVLPAVLWWHDYLRHIMRKTDTATERVLDLIESNMLCATPPQRIRSMELCKELGDILDRAKRDGRRRKKIDPSVLEGLLEFDRSAPLSEIEAKANAEKDQQKEQRYVADMGQDLAVGTVTIHRSVRVKKSEQLASVPLARTAYRAETLEKIIGVPAMRPVPIETLSDHAPILLNELETGLKLLRPLHESSSQLERDLDSNLLLGVGNRSKSSQLSVEYTSSKWSLHEPQPGPLQEPPRQRSRISPLATSWPSPFTPVANSYPHVEVVTPFPARLNSSASLLTEPKPFELAAPIENLRPVPYRETNQGKVPDEEKEVYDTGPVQTPIVTGPPKLHEHSGIFQLPAELGTQAEESHPSLTPWPHENPEEDAYLKKFIVDRDFVSITVCIQ
jgi:hypothetical protein